MLLDICLVAFDRAGLYAVQVFRRPCIKPLSDGHFRWLEIDAIIDSDSGGLHFLPYFLLGLAGEAAPELLARARIAPNGDTRLPEGIFFPIPQDGLLADVARALCGAGITLSRHCRQPPLLPRQTACAICFGYSPVGPFPFRISA